MVRGGTLMRWNGMLMTDRCWAVAPTPSLTCGHNQRGRGSAPPFWVLPTCLYLVVQVCAASGVAHVSRVVPEVCFAPRAGPLAQVQATHWKPQVNTIESSSTSKRQPHRVWAPRERVGHAKQAEEQQYPGDQAGTGS